MIIHVHVTASISVKTKLSSDNQLNLDKLQRQQENIKILEDNLKLLTEELKTKTSG